MGKDYKINNSGSFNSPVILNSKNVSIIYYNIVGHDDKDSFFKLVSNIADEVHKILKDQGILSDAEKQWIERLVSDKISVQIFAATTRIAKCQEGDIKRIIREKQSEWQNDYQDKINELLNEIRVLGANQAAIKQLIQSYKTQADVLYAKYEQVLNELKELRQSRQAQVSSNSSGNNVNNSEVKIESIQNANKEFVILNGVLKKYNGNSNKRSCNIPKGITKIADGAFEDCKWLEKIIIPYGVKSIGDHAFYGCKSLEIVTIPNSVESIGHHAFDGCWWLKIITIPFSVKNIGEYAFLNCDKHLKIYCQSGCVPKSWAENWNAKRVNESSTGDGYSVCRTISRFKTKKINRELCYSGKSTRDKSVRQYDRMVKHYSKICWTTVVLMMLIALYCIIFGSLIVAGGTKPGAFLLCEGIIFFAGIIFWLVVTMKADNPRPFTVMARSHILCDIKEVTRDNDSKYLVVWVMNVCLAIFFGSVFSFSWWSAIAFIAGCLFFAFYVWSLFYARWNHDYSIE